MDWQPDPRLRRRMALALALTLAGYAVLLAPAFWFLSLPAALVVSASVVGAVALVATRADSLVPLVTQPVAIDRDDYPELFDAVDRLSAQADMARPSVVVVPGYEPNAMSVGTGDRALVCLTVGLLDELDGEELDAVVAHELAHLKNGDSAVLTLAGFPAALAVALLAVAARYFDGWAYLFGYVLVLALVAMLAVPLLVASLPGTLALSRYREYAADRGAAALTGDPLALAAALEAFDGGVDAGAPDVDLRRTAGFTAFCLVPTPYSSLPLPSTHPPTSRRIRRLRALAGDV